MSYIRKIEIENFKAFREKQSLEFVCPPDNGLNIIVGPNNSGKSTVLDAVSKLNKDASIPKSQRHEDEIGPPVIKVFDEDSNKTEIKTIEDRGSQIEKIVNEGIDYDDVCIISSKRNWKYQFAGNQIGWKAYSRTAKRNYATNAADNDFGRLLSKIHSSPSEREEFNTLMRKIVPNFDSWTVDKLEQGSREYISYYTNSGVEHHAGLLGQGVTNLFRIVAGLFHASEGVLLIDEPEISLHPQTLKKLVAVLAERAKGQQIIVSTHSPYLVRWEDIEAGAEVIRLNKKRNSVYKGQLSEETKKKLLRLEKDHGKPYLLDLVAKEVFFAESVVFTEGQEDVSILSDYIHNKGINKNFDFFGYGAGGAGNIHSFLRMCEDLNIKGGALFDGDAAGVRFYEECKKSFNGDNFVVLKHSQKNIKDRNDEKKGLFNSKGKIKPTHEAEVRRIIKKLNTLNKES